MVEHLQGVSSTLNWRICRGWLEELLFIASRKNVYAVTKAG